MEDEWPKNMLDLRRYEKVPEDIISLTMRPYEDIVRRVSVAWDTRRNRPVLKDWFAKYDILVDAMYKDSLTGRGFGTGSYWGAICHELGLETIEVGDGFSRLTGRRLPR